VADTRQPEAEINLVLEVRVSRRQFLSLGLVGIVGLPLLGAVGCGSSQDKGDGKGKKDKNSNGGGGGGGY
jgi:hypothetical protein